MTAPKDNGVPKPRLNPFEQLANMCLALGSAKNKPEAMARLGACQKMIAGLSEGFRIQSERIGHLTNVLLMATQGSIRELALNVEGETEAYLFNDSEGKPVYVVDPLRGLLLITPDHVDPIVVTVKMKDGSEKEIIVEHFETEAERQVAVGERCENHEFGADGTVCLQCGWQAPVIAPP